MFSKVFISVSFCFCMGAWASDRGFSCDDFLLETLKSDEPFFETSGFEEVPTLRLEHRVLGPDTLSTGYFEQYVVRAEGDPLPLFALNLCLDGSSQPYVDVWFLSDFEPGKVWSIESLLFISQLPLGMPQRSDTFTERRFRGNYVYESEHSGVTASFTEPLFSDWIEKDAVPAEAEPETRYADVLNDHLTFYLERSENRVYYRAGLIASLPLDGKRLKGFATLLHLTNRYRFSEATYVKLISEAIERFKPLQLDPQG